MNFCSNCGSSRMNWEIPEGDNRNRHVCQECKQIFYSNPNIVSGCLTTWKGEILLCKRGIEPRLGFWTLPAGYLENGETVRDGAERETFEEAEARVDIDGLYTIFNLPHIAQVHVFYRGEIVNGDFGVGEESTDAALFPEENIPWNELAFPTIKKTLQFYFEDRKTGDYPIREEVLVPPSKSRS